MPKIFTTIPSRYSFSDVSSVLILCTSSTWYKIDLYTTVPPSSKCIRAGIKQTIANKTQTPMIIFFFTQLHSFATNKCPLLIGLHFRQEYYIIFYTNSVYATIEALMSFLKLNIPHNCLLQVLLLCIFVGFEEVFST